MESDATQRASRNSIQVKEIQPLQPDISEEETLQLKAYKLPISANSRLAPIQDSVSKVSTTPPFSRKTLLESPAIKNDRTANSDVAKEETLELPAYRTPLPLVPNFAATEPPASFEPNFAATEPPVRSWNAAASYGMIAEQRAEGAGSPIIQFSRSAEVAAVSSDMSVLPTQTNITSITQKKKKKWLSVGLRVGMTALLFVILFKSFSWSSLLGVLIHVDAEQLLVAFIVGFFGIIASAYQWRSLLHAERIKFDLAELVDLYLVGIAFSHFLPTGMGGDAIKAIRVGNASGNNAGSASAVVMSRVTGFFSMMLIGIPILLIWHEHFNNTIILEFLALSLLVSSMIGGAVFFAVLLPRLVKGKWIHHKIFQSGIKIGKALSVAMQRPRSLSVAILYGAIFWIGSCLNHYAYGVALGIHLPLYFYCVAVPFISLVTFLPISINGYGLREGAFVYIFSIMHVAPAQALFLALLMDAQALLFGSMGGALYLFSGTKAKDDRKQRAA